jgi:hypothetical protein
MLLVIDDVWSADQLAPFLLGGWSCARLVTTRIPSALPDDAESVVVDAMSVAQARDLLMWKLPGLDPAIVEGMLAATGRWPLLLRLVNRAVSTLVTTGMPVTEAAAHILDRLRQTGPTAVDSAKPLQQLDLDDPRLRTQAVRATIQASTTLCRVTERPALPSSASSPRTKWCPSNW